MTMIDCPHSELPIFQMGDCHFSVMTWQVRPTFSLMLLQYFQKLKPRNASFCTFTADTCFSFWRATCAASHPCLKGPQPQTTNLNSTCADLGLASMSTKTNVERSDPTPEYARPSDLWGLRRDQLFLLLL